MKPPRRTLLHNLRAAFRKPSYLYFKLLDLLHRPFVANSDKDPYPEVFQVFRQRVEQMPSAEILEIGSRQVLTGTHRQHFTDCARYVGFDVHDGEGVDVVGDAHRLSDYFPDQRFDACFSVSVFEHLLFPWKVVLEINKVLKPGGLVYVSTHPTWPEHEAPWDFWRYPHRSFSALFNKHTGFEIVNIAEGLPCKAYSLVDAAPTRELWLYTVNQGVAVLARKVGDYDSSKLRWDIGVEEVTESVYPQPEG